MKIVPFRRRPASVGKIDAVIPAYNEEQTVGAVVRALKASSCVRRVVVVSDGSEDRTVHYARLAGADMIVEQENTGKTGAMKAGVAHTATEYILFLDADLIGLTPAHVEALCRPVLSGGCEATIGVFRKGRARTDAAHVLSPYLSGQRVVSRGLFNRALMNVTDGFGVEIVLTRALKNENIPCETVPLEEMSHRTKEEKRGYWEGTKARVKMYSHILKNIRQG